MKKHYIFLLFGLVSAVLVAVFLIIKMETYLYNTEMDKIEVNHQILKERLKDFTQEKDTFIKMISEYHHVEEFLSSKNTSSLETTKTFFYNLVKGSETIMQLRLLNISGMECVRIDRTPNHKIIQIKEKDLQDKSKRDYFRKFSKLNEKSIGFSSLDLNIENNKVEVPWRPTLRIGVPVFVDGTRVGMVLINYRMDHWLENLSKITHNNFYLVDSEGYFIIHPDDNWAWSRYKTPAKNMNQFFTKVKNIKIDFSNIKISDNLFVKKINFFNNESMFALYEPKISINTLLYEKLIQVTGFILVIFILLLVPIIRLIVFFIKNLNEEILERKEAEEQLMLYHSAVEHSTSSIYITDKNGLIEYANPKFYKVAGYSPKEIIGKNPKIFKSGEHSSSYYKELWNTILSGKSWHGEMVNKYKDGRKGYAVTSISPIKDEEGNIRHFVAVREDITELKDLQAELTQKAHFDTLTNIPNRTLFFDKLGKTLAISKRKKHAFALLFIDLDSFKSINDEYGHNIGDQLLVEVSRKLQSCIRESDTLARIGGDEFVILLTEIASNDEPGIMAKRIIDILSKPIQVKAHKCNIGASIGISLYPEHSSDLDELLVLADKAMYEVKHFGKNNCRYAK